MMEMAPISPGGANERTVSLYRMVLTNLAPIQLPEAAARVSHASGLATSILRTTRTTEMMRLRQEERMKGESSCNSG